MIERDQFAVLQGEDARLIALLEDHGIEGRACQLSQPRLSPEPTGAPHDLAVTPRHC